jgi:hypothetical protein
MAIPDDFSVAVNGDIRHVSGSTNYTVLELHRWLQQVADDETPATANDYLDITSATPSERATDQIINLLGTYNIDDTAAEYFYGGSISQDGGNTLYSGLQVLGAVNDSNTQLQVIQDHDYYDTTTPFWGDQSTGGFNGNATAGILFRCLIKSRVDGADINRKIVRVQARAWGDTYDFFDVTLGEAESVAAISTTGDGQNDTAIATVQAWAGGDIPTNTEGYQSIDILNGNGSFPYYSKWTYNTNAAGMKAIWEYIKEISGNDSPEAAAPHGMNGELFVGITHQISTGANTGSFTEDETVVWGTIIEYDGLTGGTFAEGDYVSIRRATTLVNAGKVVYDDGVDGMVLALEDIATPLAENDRIAVLPAETTYSDITATAVVDDDQYGGEGILLAWDDTGDELWVQLIHGAAPVDTMEVRGITSSATAATSGTPASKTVPKIFLGSYTGSLIGAYGIGIDPDDLLSTDRVTPLVGAQQQPPNNVTWEITGLIAGDRVLVMKKHDSNNDFDFAEMTIDTGGDLVGSAETIIDVGTGNIPADAPATGTLRVELDDGRYRRVDYTSHDGDDEFTIASSDWQDPDDAAAGNGVSLAFIDKAAADTDEEFIIQYDADRTLWWRVRDGGGSPIKTSEAQSALNSTGGSAVATRIDDD